MTQRTVFFDLETGGLNPNRHPIIQIAAIAADKYLQPLEAFEVKLQFDASRANRNSLRKNHYSQGVWANTALPEKEAARQFAEFLRRHATLTRMAANGTPYQVSQLVAHNASFDGPFLEAWFERVGVFLPARRQVLCTLQRAMWHVTECQDDLPPPRDYKLSTLCRYFDVPFHAADAHDALADVKATLELYRSMTCRDPFKHHDASLAGRAVRHAPGDFAQSEGA